MNKHKYIYPVLLLVIGFSSCTKDFLNKQPLDAVTLTWATQTDAESNLVGCYETLEEGFYNYFGYERVYLDALSDDCWHPSGYDYNNITDIGRGNITSLSGAPNTVWSTAYAGISSCNIFLQNIPQTQMDATLKNQYIGEVKFLRALYYFELVNYFGDVILYTTPPTLQNADVARSPKDSVLALVYSDLNFAVANLPNTGYQGHAVQGSAAGLLARVYLYEGNWAQAAATASQVMQSATFSLYPNYGGIFMKRFQTNNPEIIFSSEYQAPNNEQNAAYGLYYGLDIELGNYAALCPYQEMVNQYETTSGKLITDPTSGYDAANPYVNRDSRLLQSIKVPGEVWYNPDGTVFTPSLTPATGFQDVKYIDTTLFPIHYSDNNKENEDLVLIRYADILLMYAEATNEATGPDGTVYAALNQVRERAGQPDVDQTVYNSQSTLRNFIRHERRIELAFEGLRYMDLIRWQTAAQVMPLVQDPGGVTVTFNANQYLWPIPQTDINVNKQLTQNPGY